MRGVPDVTALVVALFVCAEHVSGYPMRDVLLAVAVVYAALFDGLLVCELRRRK